MKSSTMTLQVAKLASSFFTEKTEIRVAHGKIRINLNIFVATGAEQILPSRVKLIRKQKNHQEHLKTSSEEHSDNERYMLHNRIDDRRNSNR